MGVQDRPVAPANIAPFGVVSAASAVTSIGHSGPASFAAAHARLAGTIATDRFPRRLGGQPIKHSPVDGLAVQATPGERMVDLALRGAREVLHDREFHEPVPVLLAAPPARPGWSQQDAEAMASQVFRSLPVSVHRSLSGLYAGGAEAGLLAVHYAAHLMRSEGVPYCLVGGVDCLLDATLLHWLEGLGRLPSRDDPAGMIPGEGASWLLLRSPSDWEPGEVLLMGLGVGRESAPWYGGAPTVGDGLTEAIRSASYSPDGERSAIVMSDLNGEDWRVREWTCAYMRNATSIGDPLDLRHPASYWGDLGAANGVALMGFAAWVLSRWTDAFTRILVTATADTSLLRAACVMMSTADGEQLE